MRVDDTLRPLGSTPAPAHLGNGAAGRANEEIVHLRKASDRAAVWLRSAMFALGLLAVAAAVVSWEAQYRLVASARHSAGIAALEAAIPDAGSLIFASLGIALALHGKRAIRARTLNVCCVAVSVGMNALAAGYGWRDLAIWVMPPVLYALASDTLIGVIRAWALARQRALGATLADDQTTPLAILGGLLLWLLRLALAPGSTLAGFRNWVIDECPVAPGRLAPRREPALPAVPATRRRGSSRPVRRAGSKTSRFLALVVDRHGPLADLPVGEVGPICARLAPEVGLNAGAARTALRRAVLAARDGERS
ncbi:MAG: hypothetical protein ACRDWG_20510 [Actinomycetes bacterium]